MKHWHLILWAGFLIVSGSCSSQVRTSPDWVQRQQELSRLFDLSRLSVITLEVTREEWSQLLKNFDANPGTEEMVRADFIWQRGEDTIMLTNIGLRPRGNVFSRNRPEGSYGQSHQTKDPDWHHAHFKLGFDQFQDQEFMGLESLNLKWLNNDPTHVREVYGYDLFRRFGVYTSSHISYTRLYIHVQGDPAPAYFGIYTMIEPIDKKFVQARFLDDQGHLWKCLWGADFKRTAAQSKMGVEDINPTNKALSVKPPYDLKTSKKEIEAARAKLYDYVVKLNTLKGPAFEKWISRHLDTETFLRYLAVNTLVGMWDDYWVNQNNYYIYLDTRGRLTYIPYDYDNSLGTGQILANVGIQDVLNMSPNHSNRPLVKKVLDIPRYEKRYRELLAELLDPARELFDVTASTNRIRQWQALIAPYTTNDTGEDMVIQDRPAGWGNTPFYRLLSGDHYGGPLPANYFTTRSYHASLQLGLIQAPVPARADFTLKGLQQHPKGYYFTIRQQETLDIRVQSEQSLTQILVAGVVGYTNQGQPVFTLPLKLGDPRSEDGIQRHILLLSAHNDQGQLQREVYTILQFDGSYHSPEVSGDTVVFRLKYQPGYEVEMRGPFNNWGEGGKIYLTPAGEGMYQLVTNKNFIPSGTEYFYRIKKGDKKRWITDYANTNNVNSGHYGPLYIYR